MPAPPPSPLLRHPSVGFIAHGDLAVITWVDDPSVEANRWLITHVLDDVAKKPKSFLILQVIASSCPTPGPEARTYVQEALRTRLVGVRRMVTVPLGDSVKQSVVRALMRGMIILSGKGQTLSVASSIDESLSIIGAAAGELTPSRKEALADLRQLFAACGVNERLPTA